MAKKIWKRKISKKVIKTENGEITSEKVEWKRDKNAERWARYDEKKLRKSTKESYSLIEKPINLEKPKVIRRKKQDLLSDAFTS